LLSVCIRIEQREHTRAARSKAGGSVTAKRGRPTDREPTGHEGEEWKEERCKEDPERQASEMDRITRE
jgi:hypothetical protein